MQVSTIMHAEPVTVAKDASLDHAMDLICERDVRHLCVLDGEALSGVISDRDLLGATGWLQPRQREIIEAPGGSVGNFMSSPPSTAAPGDPLDSVLGLIVQKRIGCVPVVEDGSLIGIVTETDILRAYSDACRRGRILPEDDPHIDAHMTRDPKTIALDASGDEAAELMHETAIRHLPVLLDSRVVGIISDRDVRRSRGRGQLEVSLVEELMSPNPTCATPDERLVSVALTLSAERISAVPVLDGKRLVGIATAIDVLLPCASALRRLD